MAHVLNATVEVEGSDGVTLPLLIRLAKVDDELAKVGTGALEAMWTRQQNKIDAATKIQALVRGKITRRVPDLVQVVATAHQRTAIQCQHLSCTSYCILYFARCRCARCTVYTGPSIEPRGHGGKPRW